MCDKPTVKIIGAGLAGCEAAYQASKLGVKVELYEMKPHKYSPAHHNSNFAELVCSNSMRSNDVSNAVGLLKEELLRMDSLIMKAAYANQVPAGSALNSCVVNGMSASHRNSPFANSGMVVEIRPEDLVSIVQEFRSSGIQDFKLKGLAFQQYLEQLAYKHGGQPAMAPAQRLKDFVESRYSKTLPACSYLPGMVSSRLDEWLPAHIGKRLQQGFRDFDRKYRGFLTNDAIILGVESRSSSAVRIPRDPDTLQSISTPGLYPCGEGAGYAGGITSCALDGINVALAVIRSFTV